MNNSNNSISKFNSTYAKIFLMAQTLSDTEVGVSNITVVDKHFVDEEIFADNMTLVPSALYNQSFSGNVVLPRSSSPIWLIPCYCIILLCAVVGNLLVISTLVQNRRMRTITNVFLLNLAISDILLGVLCMPVTLVGTLLRHFIFGEFLCKFISFSQAISVAVSSWTLVAISCERYYAICHPLRSRTWQTISHAYKIIAFIWIGSIVCMTPIAIFSQLIPTSRQGLRKCREYWPGNSIGYERSYNIFLDLLLFILPLLILCAAYILITHTLYIGMQNERALIFGGSTITTNRDSKKKHKAYQNQEQQQQQQQHQQQQYAQQDSDNFEANMSKFNNFKPTSLIQLRSLSRKRNGSSTHSLNGYNVGSSISAGDPEIMEVLQQRTQSQKLEMPQRNKRFDKNKPINANICYDEKCNSSKGGGSKRMLLTTPSGRSHLYCMRTSSFNMPSSINHYEQKDGYNTINTTTITATTTTFTTPSMSSMTVINMPQQQCFQLQQQRNQQQQHHQQKLQYNTEENERKKCNTTSSLRLPDTTLRRSNEAKTLESKRRVIKMLFVLVLEFFICWTPLYVINTFAVFIGSAMYEYIDYTSISFFQLLAYSSSCCNPITYCFMNAGFRRAFLDTFKGLQFRRNGHFCHRRQKQDHSLSMAGNSITLANSITMSNNTLLDSPRL